jgi:hypothetical protein
MSVHKSEVAMKTIITAALGILVLAAPLATAQQRVFSERELIQRAIQIKQQQEAQRRAYLNSPEYLRKQIAEIQREQDRARFNERQRQVERDAAWRAAADRRNLEIQRRYQQGTTRR